MRTIMMLESCRSVYSLSFLYLFLFILYIYIDVFHNLFPLYLYVKYLKKLLFKNYFLYAESARIIGIHRCNTLKYFQVFQEVALVGSLSYSVVCCALNKLLAT